MRNVIKDLWPTKRQYKEWSMPSKLTYIGAYLGIFTLVFSGINLSINALIKHSLNEYAIEGSWNEEDAKKAVFALLSEHQVHSNFSYKPVWVDLKHEIYGYYHLSYGNKKSVVAIAYTKPGNDYMCHGCAVSLSFIEFHKEAIGWKLGVVHLDAMHEGSWGDPPQSMKAISIGFNIFGIITEQGHSQGGYTEEYMVIHSLIGDDFREILSVQVLLDDSGTLSPNTKKWSSDVVFKQAGNSYYDINISSQGVLDGSPYNSQKVFKFDGQKYTASGLFK